MMKETKLTQQVPLPTGQPGLPERDEILAHIAFTRIGEDSGASSRSLQNY